MLEVIQVRDVYLHQLRRVWVVVAQWFYQVATLKSDGWEVDDAELSGSRSCRR